jgi:hypothetical protein
LETPEEFLYIGDSLQRKLTIVKEGIAYFAIVLNQKGIKFKYSDATIALPASDAC